MRSLPVLLILLLGCVASEQAERPLSDARSPRRTMVAVAEASGAVARLGGGAFVLRESGDLERYDRDGAFTGAVASGFRALAPAGAYVCGVGPEGVACFRDRHEERVCPSAPFAPEPEPVGLQGAMELRGDVDRPILRADGGLWEIAGTCGQHCITLGCDGPRRCMDPCPPGARPRLFARRIGTAGEFLSNEGTAGVTHPSK